MRWPWCKKEGLEEQLSGMACACHFRPRLHAPTCAVHSAKHLPSTSTSMWPVSAYRGRGFTHAAYFSTKYLILYPKLSKRQSRILQDKL